MASADLTSETATTHTVKQVLSSFVCVSSRDLRKCPFSGFVDCSRLTACHFHPTHQLMRHFATSEQGIKNAMTRKHVTECLGTTQSPSAVGTYHQGAFSLSSRIAAAPDGRPSTGGRRRERSRVVTVPFPSRRYGAHPVGLEVAGPSAPAQAAAGRDQGGS